MNGEFSQVPAIRARQAAVRLRHGILAALAVIRDDRPIANLLNASVPGDTALIDYAHADARHVVERTAADSFNLLLDDLEKGTATVNSAKAHGLAEAIRHCLNFAVSSLGGRADFPQSPSTYDLYEARAQLEAAQQFSAELLAEIT